MLIYDTKLSPITVIGIDSLIPGKIPPLNYTYIIIPGKKNLT